MDAKARIGRPLGWPLDADGHLQNELRKLGATQGERGWEGDLRSALFRPGQTRLGQSHCLELGSRRTAEESAGRTRILECRR